MKKYLLALLVFTSCGYESQNATKYNIVTQTGVSFYANDICYYEVSGSVMGGPGELFASERFLFYDRCGKYKVGDTVFLGKR